MSDVTALQAALGGPLVVALAWLGLARLPWLRTPVAGLLALGAHAAAWWVFWLVYRGDQVAWRSFTPELLGATLLAVVELTVLLAAIRAETLPGGGNAAAIVGLAVSASAIAALAYTDSLAVMALALPVPTVAVAGAAFSSGERRDTRGLIGLAAADAIALIGLSLTYSRTGSIILEAAGGAGPTLLLVSAIVKAGVIPWLGTWRLASGAGPASWLDGALRGQAVILASLAALTMRASAPASALAILAAVSIAAGGAVAVYGGGRGRILAAASGAAAGLPFLSLGLGGAVGTRAFLLLFPAVLLASALVALLVRAPDQDDERSRETAKAGAWAWLSACAAGVGLASLLGMPPGGGFPGSWLTISLASARSEVTLGWLLVAAAAAAGLTAAFIASVRLIRAASSSPVHSVVGVIVAVGLLYLGTQPIRVAIGWWIRVETGLSLPEVLPTAGAPGLPAIGGVRLLLLLAPAVVLVGAVVALGRGFRAEGSWAFTIGVKFGGYSQSRLGIKQLRRMAGTATAAMRPLTEQVARARALGVGYAIAAILELAALLMVGRIVLLSARSGFL